LFALSTWISSFPEAPPVRWRVTYADLDPSSVKDDSKPFLNRSTFLILKPHAKKFVLLDSKEQVLDARFLLLNEKVRPGQLMDLTFFTVLVGGRVVSDSIMHALQMNNPSTSPRPSVEALVNPSVKQVANSEIQDVAFVGFDFNQGKGFVDACLRKFGQRVNLVKFSRRKPFFLVCSFGRACFRLDVHTVAVITRFSSYYLVRV
jgi:hypothetical protein